MINTNSHPFVICMDVQLFTLHVQSLANRRASLIEAILLRTVFARWREQTKLQFHRESLSY